MPRRRRKASLQCPNCGHVLHEGDHFCAHCGQENHDLRVPFRHFAYEFVESVTHFDTKLWSTLKMIFTRPGQLTKDFVEGKRARYVKPAQFYVFVSFIFYALLTHVVDHGIEDHHAPVIEQTSRVEVGLDDAIPDSVREAVQGDSLYLGRIRILITAPDYGRIADRLRPGTNAVLDSLMRKVNNDTTRALREHLRTALAALPMGDELDVPYTNVVNGVMIAFQHQADERLLRQRLPDFTDAQYDSLLIATSGSTSWLDRQFMRALGNVDTHSATGRKQIVHAVIKASSFIMFLLMPFTAVLLLGFFYRKRYYWEHLIFAVHIHTIYFLFFAVLLVIGLLVPKGLPDGVVPIAMLGCMIYLVLALRRVYGRPWGSTLLRLLAMSIPYMLVAFILLITGAVLGFFSVGT